MSSSFGSNSKPKATSDAYRESSYWVIRDEAKKKEKEKQKK